MNSSNVLTPKRAPNENTLRDSLADGLAFVQGSSTDQDAADMLGWSIGTVRNVRNRTNTASLKIVSDALHNVGPAFIAPLLAKHYLRAVPMNATCTTDAGIHSDLAKLGLKIAIAMEDEETSPCEARDMLPELDRFQGHIDRLRRLAGVVA